MFLSTADFSGRRSLGLGRDLVSSGPWAVLGALLAVHAVSNLLAPRLLSGGWNLYVAQPALWLALAWFCARQDRGLLRGPSVLLLGLALLAGAFHAGMFALAGLLYGFGYSGYAQQPAAIAANVFYLSSLLTGMELARAYLLRCWGGSVSAVTALVLLFGGLALTVSQLQALTAGGRPAFEAGGGTLLPETVESFVATELALAGGPWLAIAYRAVPLFCEWLSPVLPQLDWMLGAMVGSVAPALALLALRPALAGPAGGTTEANKGVPGWALAAGAMVAGAIWLNTGLLGVRPALVSGISMQPNLVLGDIVLTRPVAPESLRPGDVIRFRDGAVSIVHRIVAVQQSPSGLVFRTRGDNNEFVDPPVSESAVEGRVVLTVPKLGLLPIELKTLLQEAGR